MISRNHPSVRPNSYFLVGIPGLQPGEEVNHVNHEKIKAMTHRQRTDLMGRLEVFLETELPAAIKEDITHYWDTIGFELPGTDWTVQGRI